MDAEYEKRRIIYDPVICSMCRDNFKYSGFSRGNSINLRYITDKNQAECANYRPQDNIMEINMDSVYALYSKKCFLA